MNYQYIEPDEYQKKLMKDYADRFELLTRRMDEDLPFNRSAIQALRKLEEAFLWLNRAITNNDSAC